MKNLYNSLFGESPETQQARETRNATFQDMLNSRRQAAQQNFTDNAKMAKYNALGNVLTTMVQPLGWAAGGATVSPQKYDDRQYIDSFNRALKAQDDLRNIGTAEDQYRFNLAEQDYNRLRDIEDNERRYQFQMDKQQQQQEYMLEKQRRDQEARQALEEHKAEQKEALERLKASLKITDKKTGLSLRDRQLLKEMDYYNDYVKRHETSGQPYDTFDKWMSTRGYQVNSANPTRSSGSGSNRSHAQL